MQTSSMSTAYIINHDLIPYHNAIPKHNGTYQPNTLDQFSSEVDALAGLTVMLWNQGSWL